MTDSKSVGHSGVGSTPTGAGLFAFSFDFNPVFEVTPGSPRLHVLFGSLVLRQ